MIAHYRQGGLLMKVFISWSGEKSRRIAEIFRNWLPGVLQAVKPYFSPDDISKGARWSAEVSSELNSAKVGLIILTRSNLEAPWIMFEAGALSKNIDTARVCPILFGIEESDIQGPLVQFQASKFTKEDIKKIVIMINDNLNEHGLSKEIIDSVFDMWWPSLEQDIAEANNIKDRKLTANLSDAHASRSEKDILEEILNLSRNSIKEHSDVLSPMKEIQDSINEIKSIIVDDRLKRIYQQVSDGQEQEVSSVDETVNDEEDQELVVIEWLATRGITVRNYSQSEPSDAIYDELSLFMGERFSNISRIYNLLKRNLSSGHGVTLNLSDAPADEIRDTTFFCNKLAEYAFLSSYKYNKYTKKVYATSQRSGKVINFFSGGWYERYIFLKMTSFLTQNSIEFYSLRNPQVLIADAFDFELDILLLIEGIPYWLECKIGDHHSYIGKLVEVRRMLSIPPDNSFLVVLNLPDNLSEDLSKVHEITLANQNNYLLKLSSSIDLNDANFDSTIKLVGSTIRGNIPITTEDSLIAFFKKNRMRPCREHRCEIIHALVSIFTDPNCALSFVDVKAKISSKLNISRSKVQDVLRALFKSNVFITTDGEDVNSFSDMVSGLRFTDVAEIDKQCVLTYGRCITDSFKSYFDEPVNLELFEQVVSCFPLTSDVIEELVVMAEDESIRKDGITCP
jgi:hypothetical protein